MAADEPQRASRAMNTPTIVAEISCNHMGNKAKALRLIDEAAKAGADAVKFQLFEPDEMAWPTGNVLGSGPWRGQSLIDLYRATQTPRAWFPALFAHAEEAGLVPFASVFSVDGVRYLEDNLACPWYKIASAEVVWPELLDAVAATGKPVIISDGMATGPEVRQALDILGPSNTTVLRCVSDYPACATDYGFGDMPPFGKRSIKWGLSDHSLEITTASAAAALGASMIEAHLMLPTVGPESRPLDYSHSYTPGHFSTMVWYAREAARMARAYPKKAGDFEGWRRRLVWARDLPIGHKVQDGDVACLRGDRGIQPCRRRQIVGKHLSHSVQAGTGVEGFHVRRR